MLQRLLQARAFRNLLRQINRHHLGIVLGVKADAVLFVTPAKLMVVGDVPVVYDRQVRITVAPEGLRMAQIDARFGGEPGVANAVGAFQARNAVGLFEILRRARLLDDLESVAHADDFEILVERFDGIRQLFQIGLATHQKPGIGPGGGEVAHAAECFQPRANLVRSRLQSAIVAQLDAHDEPAVIRRAIERHAGRIRATAAERPQHAENGSPDLGLPDLRLPDVRLPAAVLRKKSDNAAHWISGYSQYTTSMLDAEASARS